MFIDFLLCSKPIEISKINCFGWKHRYAAQMPSCLSPKQPACRKQSHLCIIGNNANIICKARYHSWCHTMAKFNLISERVANCPTYQWAAHSISPTLCRRFSHQKSSSLPLWYLAIMLPLDITLASTILSLGWFARYCRLKRTSSRLASRWSRTSASYLLPWFVVITRTTISCS